MMEIIPAVDLKGGKCVRLIQGQMDKETVYYDDPLDAASLWVDQGAPRLHLVDLDGAVLGSPQNLPAIERIVDKISVPVQLGGGIRNEDDISRCLEIGVERVILGTLACQDPKHVGSLADRYPLKILLGVDARDGYVAVKGWRDITGIQVLDLLASYPNIPIAGVIYTDIQRDGMLAGPNVPAIERLLSGTSFPVIASGGVTNLKDVEALARLESRGLCGAIVGKALYSGKMDYRAACNAASLIFT